MKTNIRTFRDFVTAFPAAFSTYHGWKNACRFCHRNGDETLGLWKYSTRHYICNDCLNPRLDTVLPSVLRHDRFDKKMRRLHPKVCPVCQDSACETKSRECGK